METERAPDAVDSILAQWRRERPDLDCGPMGTIGRIKRCAALLQRRQEEVFSAYGMSSWEFDVLATLKRSGAPYRLAPTALFSSLMITSGTMTHRLKGLETRGLVLRVPHSGDARSVLVQLTADGLDLIERAVTAHVANQHRILASTAADDLAAIDAALSRLLGVLEPGAQD
ncbi:MarR family transcriptional regulator [Massilia sp. P8910]|uniref:MarR family transcriptional regulator n=1 Tax=Massilia antarctica TaxID=2765360 RepID=A0AA48WAM4_9BURK|nr:MarR family transcriptional regulator [Massilia antarctica]MCE3606205.1 MarR family transcriptional regulator [Massilia antarctica]QPI48193.1 MarR family transcriptional regulator [Massilia antarctica]